MKKTILTTLLLASLFVINTAQTSEFYDKVNYKGAFGSTNWLKGWTALDHYTFLKPNITPLNTVTVTDARY